MKIVAWRVALVFRQAYIYHASAVPSVQEKHHGFWYYYCDCGGFLEGREAC